MVDVGDRLHGSNHRLVWCSLRARTKISVKTGRLARATCTSGLEVNHQLRSETLTKPRNSFVRVSCESVGSYRDPIFMAFAPGSSQKGGVSRLGRVNILI